MSEGVRIEAKNSKFVFSSGLFFRVLIVVLCFLSLDNIRKNRVISFFEKTE